jgi:Family of unknown function (DUF5670)
MLLWIAIIVFLLWLLGHFLLHIVSLFFHLLVLAAAVLFVWHLINGRR